jgi:dTDP-4-dehydrorhamnose reductase
VAVLGATGQLGYDVLRVADEQGVDVVGLDHDDVEVRDPDTLRKAFGEVEPRAVLHCAAFHAVDACESEPGKAYDVNAVGALNVARAAREVDARTVYVSTDYVFGGDKAAPDEPGPTDPETAYLEEDRPKPLNVYGASKLAGEQLTLQADPDALVARVSSLFGIQGARGKGGGNFVDTMLDLADDHDELQGVADQWMTPTYTRHAAEALLELADADAAGRIHVTNPEACTWYHLAEHALRAAGDETPIERVSHTAFPSEADRPLNSALHTGRLEDVLGRSLPHWREAVEAYVAEKTDT